MRGAGAGAGYAEGKGQGLASALALGLTAESSQSFPPELLIISPHKSEGGTRMSHFSLRKMGLVQLPERKTLLSGLTAF